MRVMHGWAGGSSPDPAQGLTPLDAFQPWALPGLPAPPRCLRHGAEQVHRRQVSGRFVSREAPTYFAFQLVREAACVFLAAQCALSPFTRVSEQIVVVQFS